MDFIFSLAYFILNICVADSKPENLRFRIAINVFLKTRKVAFEQGRKGMLELLTVRSVLALELVEKEAEDKYERVESRRCQPTGRNGELTSSAVMLLRRQTGFQGKFEWS